MHVTVASEDLSEDGLYRPGIIQQLTSFAPLTAHELGCRISTVSTTGCDLPSQSHDLRASSSLALVQTV
jgi:hypothetical protein